MDFLIKGTGAIDPTSSALQSTFPGPEMGKCVQDVISELTFPEAGEAVTVTVPFEFDSF